MQVDGEKPKTYYLMKSMVKEDAKWYQLAINTLKAIYQGNRHSTCWLYIQLDEVNF